MAENPSREHHYKLGIVAFIWGYAQILKQTSSEWLQFPGLPSRDESRAQLLTVQNNGSTRTAY